MFYVLYAIIVHTRFFCVAVYNWQ